MDECDSLARNTYCSSVLPDGNTLKDMCCFSCERYPDLELLNLSSEKSSGNGTDKYSNCSAIATFYPCTYEVGKEKTVRDICPQTCIGM